MGGYETFALDKPDAGNARLRVYKSGTGTYRGMEFQTGGSARLTISAAGAATFSGSLAATSATFSSTVSINSQTGINISADCAGNVGYTALYFFLDNSTSDATGHIRLARTAGTAFLGMEIAADAKHGIRFLTTDGGTLTERLKIDQNGTSTFSAHTNLTTITASGNIYTTGVATANAGSIEVVSADPTLRLTMTLSSTDKKTVEFRSADDKLYIRAWNDAENTATTLQTIDLGTKAAIFTGSLKAVTILDSNDSAGTSNQVLTSTGTALDWKTLSEISGVDGSGTANYLSKWTDSDTIGNSIIYASAASVGISSVAFTSPAGTLHTQAVGANITYLDAYSTTNGTGSMLNFRKSDNNTAGTKTQTDSGDTLASIGFYGVHSESDWGLGAGINVSQDGVSGTAYVPAHIAFATCTATAYAEKMRITSAGFVGIGTASPDCSLHIEKLTGGTDVRISAGDYGTNYGGLNLDSVSFGISTGNAVRALGFLHTNQNATFSGSVTVEGDDTDVENLYVNQEAIFDGHAYPYADSSYTPAGA